MPSVRWNAGYQVLRYDLHIILGLGGLCRHNFGHNRLLKHKALCRHNRAILGHNGNLLMTILKMSLSVSEGNVMYA